MPKYRPIHLLRTHKSAISDGKDSSCRIYVTSVHFRICAVMTAMHLNFPQENRRRRSSGQLLREPFDTSLNCSSKKKENLLQDQAQPASAARQFSPFPRGG